MSGFYRKTETQLYVNQMNFHLKSDAELAKIFADGTELYNKLFPRKSISPLAVVAIVAIAVVAVAAVAAAGAASAGGAAAAASTGAAAAAPGVASVAATTGATASSVMSTVQTVAGYVSAAGKVYAKATGKNPPDKLMAAADVVSSGSSTDAIKSAVGYQLKQENLKVAKGNRNSEAALDVLVQREQQKYASQLRQAAELEARRLNVPITPKPAPMGAKDWLPIAVPVVLFLLKAG